jgi:hypothetical protein
MAARVRPSVAGDADRTRNALSVLLMVIVPVVVTTAISHAVTRS